MLNLIRALLFCSRSVCTAIFPLVFPHFICFFDLTRPSRIRRQPPTTPHTMCGNNFSIIVKFCFIFLPALLLGIPSIFLWHSWLFTSPAAKMQFMVESEFRFASFYFRLIFACLCFFFQFFFIFCGLILFGMVV